jgi:chromosomal replication initiator protein
MDPQLIIEIVAQYYKMDVAQLKKTTKIRYGELVKTRQITMFFLRKFTKLSQARTGQFYGKDHATVLHACNQVNNLYDTDKDYRREINEIEHLLKRSQRVITEVPLQYSLMSVYGKVINAQPVEV